MFLKDRATKAIKVTDIHDEPESIDNNMSLGTSHSHSHNIHEI